MRTEEASEGLASKAGRNRNGSRDLRDYPESNQNQPRRNQRGAMSRLYSSEAICMLACVALLTDAQQEKENLARPAGSADGPKEPDCSHFAAVDVNCGRFRRLFRSSGPRIQRRT